MGGSVEGGSGGVGIPRADYMGNRGLQATRKLAFAVGWGELWGLGGGIPRADCMVVAAARRRDRRLSEPLLPMSWRSFDISGHMNVIFMNQWKSA